MIAQVLAVTLAQVNLLSAFESSRLDLARLTVQGKEELQRALEQAVRASANALHVARVGVWFLSPDASELLCACQFSLDGDVVQSGTVLSLADKPHYKAGLMSRRVVVANDARRDAETCELSASYLEPNGITSLLDAPVYRFGDVVGVVCHEHIGPLRTWTPRDRDFVSSVADIIAVLLEQASRVDGELALRAQRKKAEQLERVAVLARFAAGVAHDFNNVLAAIGLQLEVIRAEAGPNLQKDIADAAKFADAGKDIVAQLLAYCRGGPREHRVVDLSRVLADQRRMLLTSAGHSHRLTLDIAEERLPVHGDPAQLGRVVLNLFTNAMEAMPGGGEVVIALEAAEEWAKLSVSDQGGGIDENVRERIFEPFFTTKGTGTGLGLSTVFNIVQDHNGLIDVESVKGQGTKFVIRLPRVDD